MNPKEQYIKDRDRYKKQLEQLNNQLNFYSNLRLLIIVIGIILSIWFYSQHSYLYLFNTLIITLVVFLGLVAIHHRIHTLETKTSALYQLNDCGVKHIDGQWSQSEENGEEYIDDSHSYSWDLDIFGKHSLFQWINHTNTLMGKEKLRDALINPVKSIDVISKRQKAVIELISIMEWVHEFRATGIINKNLKQDYKKLLRWCKEVNSLYSTAVLKFLVRLLPIISLSMLTFAYFTPISYSYGVILIAIQVIITIINFRTRHEIVASMSQYRQQIKVYEQMIKSIEKQQFQSLLLKSLQNQMIYQEKELASMQIKKLDGIMDMLSLRQMQFYVLFNIITIWDYHCVIALENWKNKYGKHLEKWLDSLGEFEALISLGTIAYEQSNWVMPTITKNHEIKAEEIGHPLINEKDRVCNHITFGESSTSLLITGSNMSGKSTFLRTIGINLVLAYAGGPVCATSFSCPILNIYTSMRVKDDIDNKVSSFYAELLRIKNIIKAIDKGEKVFYLLDEIFKGTNSRDRHIGAKTLIKKLSNEQTLGLVSTHDLELADLAFEPHSRIKNFHFQEYYKDNKIYFDYKLYKGVSDTFNAVYLMKQIGIEI
ncbi:MutS-related protein [Vallitalea okinawensis]|uniref:MutS-related protein n=1 Tax=Vallitalea okinawensis TaxID=2078660 RepID=UPI000CFC44B5|nr:MutS family DNA mismatch repair protein [Vallitalea okinawensis]